MVDDEEFCISTMKALLFNLEIDIDIQVDFCINGLEALNHIKDAYKHGLSYKVILTDFSMPIMDGIESTRQIKIHLRQYNEKPKIYGITGHVLDSFKEQGIKAGMDEIFSKPLNKKSLIYILKHNEILWA